VFHLAAQVTIRGSFDRFQDDLDTNVMGTARLLRAVDRERIKWFTLASSSSVYGGAEIVPTPESAPLQPRSPYAVSKLAAEWYTRSFPSLFPLETVSLRYFNVFGPRQRPDAAYAAVIPLFATALLRGEQPTVFGDGTTTRDFTFVSDVVAANLAAAEAPSTVSGNVYNIAPGSSSTLLELLDHLGEIIGHAPDPAFADSRVGDVPRACADASAARRDLGWAPEVAFADGLRQYVDWLRAQPG
jgi:UDP-glucose 4-epimerase